MDFEIEVVEGAKHGFAVRGDPSKEEEAKHCQVAEGQSPLQKILMIYVFVISLPSTVSLSRLRLERETLTLFT